MFARSKTKARSGLIGHSVLAAALSLSMVGAAGVATAKEMKGHGHGSMAMPKAGKLVVERAWARASVARNGAAYVTIRNDGKEVDRLVAASSPVAKTVELHTHTMDNGVMRMRQIKAVEVHPGTPAVLQPGGNHIMLIGLNRKLTKGDSFPMTLQFAKSGKVTVTVSVMAIAAKGMDHKHGGHKHGGHKHGGHKHTN